MPHLMPISGSDINNTFYSPYFTSHSPHYNSLCSILDHFNIAIGFGQRLFRALMIQRRGFASTSLSEKESFRFETKLESCSPESGPEWQGRVVKLSSGKGGGEVEREKKEKPGLIVATKSTTQIRVNPLRHLSSSSKIWVAPLPH